MSPSQTLVLFKKHRKSCLYLVNNFGRVRAKPHVGQGIFCLWIQAKPDSDSAIFHLLCVCTRRMRTQFSQDIFFLIYLFIYILFFCVALETFADTCKGQSLCSCREKDPFNWGRNWRFPAQVTVTFRVYRFCFSENGTKHIQTNRQPLCAATNIFGCWAKKTWTKKILCFLFANFFVWNQTETILVLQSTFLSFLVSVRN